jgi:hypothetical protein
VLVLACFGAFDRLALSIVEYVIVIADIIISTYIKDSGVFVVSAASKALYLL